MPGDIVFDSTSVGGSVFAGVGTIKICCMHDPYDLRCPVCGHSVFSHIAGAAYACEGCGVQLSLFPDREGCRFLMEVQGA